MCLYHGNRQTRKDGICIETMPWRIPILLVLLKCRNLSDNDNDKDNDNEDMFITIDLHIYKIQNARYKYTEKER